MAVNLYKVFQRTARAQPQTDAILGPGPQQRLSYGALDEAVRLLGEQFLGAGMRPGACVGLHCPSGAAYIASTYAAWFAGACVVPIAAELTGPEKETILRTVALDFVISPPRSASFLAPCRRGPEIELTGDLAGGLALYPVRPLREPPESFRSLNAAFVRFTSGTTADARGVVLSHESVLARVQAANAALELGPDDRVVWLLSMAYHFAVSIVAYLSYGAGIILAPNHFAQAVLNSARTHKGTVIYGSPAHYAWLAGVSLDSIPRGEAPLPSLRLAVSTTASLDRATAERFRAVFGLPLTQALGIIEVGLPFINTQFAHARPDALGRVLPAYEVRLEDVGLGGGLRELWLRGPGLLDAYYDPWLARSAFLHDGWFRTGDVCEADASGCLALRGRLKEVVSVLGLKFFPQEVEAVLLAHPAVEAACVFAAPDPRQGEVPHARVVLRPGAWVPGPDLVHRLTDHCRRQLASFKTPQHIEFVSSLPRTASGKVLHRPVPLSTEAASGSL
jgi:long-chain acyl-CoA synthetase